MRLLTTMLLAVMTTFTASAQTELTTEEAKALYSNTSKKRVSVHDPSVVYEPSTQRYFWNFDSIIHFVFFI